MNIKDVSSLPPAEAIAYVTGMAAGVAQAVSAAEIFHDSFSQVLDTQLLDKTGEPCDVVVSLGVLVVLDSMIAELQHLNNEFERLLREIRARG